MTLGAKLKNLRNEKDYTQSEMVNALNSKYGTKINTAMWSKWENDKNVVGQLISGKCKRDIGQRKSKK